MKKNKFIATILIFLVVLSSLFSACLQGQEQDLFVKQGEQVKWIRESGCEFSSSDESIAIINQDGVIFGVSVGTCVMTAVTGNKQYTVTVHVISNDNTSKSSQNNLNSSNKISWLQTSSSYNSEQNTEFSSSLDNTATTSASQSDVNGNINSTCVSSDCDGLASDNSASLSDTNADFTSSSTYVSSDYDSLTSENFASSSDTNADFSSSSIYTTNQSSTSSQTSNLNSSSTLSSETETNIQEEREYFIDLNGGEIDDLNWTYIESSGLYYSQTLVELPLPNKIGYNFLGWYLNDTLVTSPVLGETIVALWEEITYNIYYELDGGENNSLNVAKYGYFDQTIPLYEPTKENYVFYGWYLDADFTQQVFQVVNTGENVVLYAKFDTGYNVTYIYNGAEYSFTVAIDEKMTKPQIQTESGYFIEWFIDQDCTESYNFNILPTQNLVLYGKEYKELSKSFFGYENNIITEVNSLEEFQYYLEYTFFNEITSDNYVKLNIDLSEYLNDSTKMSQLINKTTCPFIQLARSTKTVDGDTYFQVRVVENVPETFLTQDGKGTLTQLSYAGYAEDDSFVSQRDITFDDFAYLSLEQEVAVTNSNQLFFALEHRVKPIPTSGSNAEIALNKCKAILREICDDTMSDKQKVIAIYKYVIMNTEYVLPTETATPDVLFYDAFYMEGVLNNGAAVCDGIAKTVSALCNIEGIRCVRATSSSHAWNEVFVDGQWLVLDATHGNIQISQTEVLSFGNCLISEEIKESMSYVDTLRTEIDANGTLNIYEQMTFTVDNAQYDYVISSQDEMTALFSYCLEQGELNGYSCFTVEIMTDFSGSFSNKASKASTNSGLSQTYSYTTYSLSSNMGDRDIYLLIFNN